MPTDTSEQFDRGVEINKFLVCPECGSDGRATLELVEAYSEDFDDTDGVSEYALIDLRAVCRECGHETEWYYDIDEEHR